MKRVLVIEDSSLFRDYLRLKLQESGVKVFAVANPMEAVAKMKNLTPELIILNNIADQKSYMELLKQKKNDANTTKIPVVIMAQSIEQKMLLDLLPYNVKKVFAKPIKVDNFFTAISEILDVNFKIDKSPGIVEVRANDNIIFIEIAQGLNSDKLEILRFKIRELMSLYKIRVPKVLVMLSDIKLNEYDISNIVKLFDAIFQGSSVQPFNVCILSNDDLIRSFIIENKEYSEMKVVTNLMYAMEILIPGTDKDYEGSTEIIGRKLLKARERKEKEEMLLKFEAEGNDDHSDFINNVMPNLRIAVIDDDFVTLELIKNIFKKTGATVNAFMDGEEFLIAIDAWDFDLAFLDINMPRVNGFQVLQALQTRSIKYPIVVLSAISQQDAIVKAIQMGVKSYLTKPLKPEEIFYKSIEILKANF